MVGSKVGKTPISAALSVIVNAHLDDEQQLLRVRNYEKSRGGTVIKSLTHRGSMEEVLVLESKEVQLMFHRLPRNDGLSHVLFPDLRQS